MKISRVLATLALGALAVAVVTASFFLIRSPEPDLAADSVSVDVASQTPQGPTPPTKTPAPVPQIPAGAPVQRAVPPNLNSDDDDWCDPRSAQRDDDCDDHNDDWGDQDDDQGDDWDDDIDDDQDD
ncbi:hypothetical protein ACWFOS_16025 [Gordonia terrae]